MGTHPIFESDFDCLTEKMSRVPLYVARRGLAVTSMAPSQHLPIAMIGDVFRTIGSVKKSEEVVPYSDASCEILKYKNEIVDATNHSKFIQPAEDEASFNGIEAIKAGNGSNGTSLQAVNVTDESCPPLFRWYIDYKTRLGRDGHHTKMGMLLDDQQDGLNWDVSESRSLRVTDHVRQGWFARINVADVCATKRDILDKSEWAPQSADHHYLKPAMQQWQDEKVVLKRLVNHYQGLGDRIRNMEPNTWSWVRN